MSAKKGLALVLMSLVWVIPADAAGDEFLSNDSIHMVSEDRKTHEVGPRETLFSISRQYGITVQDLRDWNSLTSDALSPGKVLYVESEPEASQQENRTPPRQQTAPTERTTPETVSGSRSSQDKMHQIVQGETLYSVARAYDISVQQLVDWNELQSSSLSIGQQLIVGKTRSADQPADQPVTAAEPDRSERLQLDRDGPAYSVYAVRRGDTLSAIARANGLSVAELRSMNELRSDVLSIGQELIVGRESGSSGITGLSVESTAQGRFYAYEVKSSDSISNLLSRHQMDEVDFKALNPGLSSASVRSGQQIILLAPPTIRHRNPYRKSAPAGSGNEELVNVTVYSSSERGQSTTSGELYSPAHLTAAHPTLTLGSVVHIKNPENGRGIFVLINDRTTDNRLKLSEEAFRVLALAQSGTPRVMVDDRLDR